MQAVGVEVGVGVNVICMGVPVDVAWAVFVLVGVADAVLVAV